MKTENGQLGIGREHDRRHRALESLRLVDRYVRNLVVLQEANCALGILLVEPAAMAELDRDRKVQALPGLEDQLARLARWEHPLRKLDEHGAELVRLDQRFEGVPELLIHRIQQLARQVLAVGAFFLLQLRPQVLLDRLWQAGHLGRLPRRYGLR